MTVNARGDLAVTFELPDTSGRLVRFDPLAPGYKLLVFYKNTCPTCQFALPVYDRLAQSAPGVFCAAISQDTPEEARTFAKDFGMTMQHLVDAKPYAVSRLYGILNVPSLFLVDPAGQVELFSPAFVKSHLLDATSLLSPKADPDTLYAPFGELPQLKPG